METFLGHIKQHDVQRIFTDVLIPGKGEPVKNALVVIKNGVIIWVGLAKEIPSKFNSDDCKDMRRIFKLYQNKG